MFNCQKLYRKTVKIGEVEQDVILATSGENFSGLLFVEWYGSGKERPELLVHGEADFSVLVLTREGLFEYDRWCVAEKVLNKVYAIGSGAKAAMGAMLAGTNARRAVEIACEIDPYSAPPVVTMALPKVKKKPDPLSKKGRTLPPFNALSRSGMTKLVSEIANANLLVDDDSTHRTKLHE